MCLFVFALLSRCPFFLLSSRMSLDGKQENTPSSAMPLLNRNLQSSLSSSDEEDFTPKKSLFVKKKKHVIVLDDDDDDDDDEENVAVPAPATTLGGLGGGSTGWIKRTTSSASSGGSGKGSAKIDLTGGNSSSDDGDAGTGRKKKPAGAGGKKRAYKKRNGSDDDSDYEVKPKAKKKKTLTTDLQAMVDNGDLTHKQAAALLPKNGRTASARPRRAAAVGARRAVKETLSKRSPGMSDFVVEDDEDEASQGSDDGESENEEELAEFGSSEEETDVSGESEMSSSSDESDHGGDQDEEFDEEDAARDRMEEKRARALMKDCKKIGQSIRKTLQMMYDGTQKKGASQVIGAKEAAAFFPGQFALKGYQLTGLNWLIQLRKHSTNGILADEMGLGKTVQAIAMLVYLMEKENVRGPHLIVIPASTKDNWAREFNRWAPGLRLFSYYGTQAERQQFRSEFGSRAARGEIDVLLSTYSIFERESCYDDRAFLGKFHFEYVVCDEAHSLKNSESRRFRNLDRLVANNRLLLSGTPVQNNMKELLAMIRFAMPGMFKSKSKKHMANAFVSYFEKRYDARDKTQDASQSRIVKEVRAIIDAFILRRLKSEVMKDMPPKKEETVFLPLTESHKGAYNWMLDEISKQRANIKNSKSISSMFAELRKAANHPLLLHKLYLDRMDQLADIAWRYQIFGNQSTKARVKEYLASDYNDFHIHGLCQEYTAVSDTMASWVLPDEVLLNSSKFQYLETLLPKLVSEGHRMLIFSQWTSIMDILELLMESLGLFFLRLDGSTTVSERQELIDTFNNEPKKYPVFLLSTRAGGLGINLTSADTVILHDIDFNPQIDRQAVDRVHRIGQTKPVSVYRLVCKSTVDEKIFEISEAKYVLDQRLLGDAGAGKEKKGSGASSSRDASKSMKELLEGALRGGKL